MRVDFHVSFSPLPTAKRIFTKKSPKLEIWIVMPTDLGHMSTPYLKDAQAYKRRLRIQPSKSVEEFGL